MGKTDYVDINRNKKQWTFFIALTIVVLVALLLCVRFVQQLGQVTTDETDRYLDELTSGVVCSVSARTQSNLDALESIALSYAPYAKQGGADLTRLRQRAEILNFDRIYIMKLDGSAVCADGSTYDFSPYPQIMRALQGQQIILNNAHIFSTSDEGFLYAVPIYDQGEIVGAMVANNTSAWIKQLLEQKYFDGDGFFHIIETDGDFVIKSDSAYIQFTQSNFFTALGSEASFAQGYSLAQMQQQIANGQSGVVKFSLNYDDIPKIGRFVPMENGFYLFMVVTEKAATRQFDMLLRESVILNCSIALLFIILLFVLFYIYKRSNRRLASLAFVDPVTRGYSQVHFEMEAQKLLSSAPDNTYSFVSVNVEKFKLINDAFGTAKGDRTLRYIHDTLQKKLQPGELVCRSYSDHFDLLIKTRSQADVLADLQAVSEEINSFNSQSNQKYFISLSVGIYQIEDNSAPIVNLRDRANVARKDSRAASGNQLFSCVFYSDIERQRQQREKEMENKMSAALKNGEFVVYLQPKIDLQNGHICGAEALVRWQDEQRGLIPPDDFILFFEKNGFIVKVDLYVFEQVCKLIRRWLDTGLEPVQVSVNLSRVHLNDPAFLQQFIAISQKYNIPPELLEIELTETLVFENLEAVIQVVDDIHQAGFRCSLDDFGSGYSSLNMLKDINVDILKLDRAFFRSPKSDNQRERAIIESVVEMAKKLEMDTISEGVETIYQLEFLKEIRCDMAQGFVISKPIQISDFERLVYGDISPSQPSSEG